MNEVELTFDDPLIDMVFESIDGGRMVVSHGFTRLTTYMHGKIISRMRAPRGFTLDQRHAAIVGMINQGAASEDPAEIAAALAWVNKRRDYLAGTTSPAN